MYASLRGVSGALHLDVFEQPGHRDFFSTLVESFMSLISQTVAFHRKSFDQPGAPRIFQAPGRVNLIGDHTDYNDGFVLPAAIDRQIVIAATPRKDSLVNVYAMDQWDHFDLQKEIAALRGNFWGNYIRGVAWSLLLEGRQLKGMDAAVAGDIPIGAGLSSSAAIEVAAGYAMLQLSEQECDRRSLALAAQKAESDFVGMRCGIMDQYISCLGRQNHALLIDCRDLGYRAVPLPPGAWIAVVDSGVHRGLVDKAYNARRLECETAAARFGVRALRDVSLTEFGNQEHELAPNLRRRARHVISENDRTLSAARALAADDLKAVGTLMVASHASLRDDFEVSCLELDLLVETALSVEGVYGARLTGAGFGGSIVALLQPEAVADLTDAIAARYGSASGRQATVLVCKASEGVSETTNYTKGTSDEGFKRK
jgi:galactokinase